MTLSISPIVPTASAQAATLDVALQPGTIVSAQVLQLLDANLVRIAIANLTLDVATTLPLQAGQTLQLAVTQTNDGISLVPVLPQNTSPARQDAVVLDDIPLSPKTPDAARPALSPQETRAVNIATQAAVTKQTSLSPLFANLTSAVTSGTLPQPVLIAAAQLLGLRVPSDRALTGGNIKTALQSSGLLREATLAVASSSQATALPDIKAALTVLRQALATWVGDPVTKQSAASPIATAAQQAALADTSLPSPVTRVAIAALKIVAEFDAGDAFAPDKTIATTNAPRLSLPAEPNLSLRTATTPPPFRDALPSAQAVASPSLAPDAEPATIAHQLIADTDGALARQTLLQIASLPEQVAGLRNEPLQPRWNFEIPFVTPQGTAMAHLAISRDGTANEADPAQRVWRARFSLDVEPAGPVHALISFSGDITSVKMWAERPATAAQLRVNAAQLNASLDRAELKAGDIVIADGAPIRGKAPRAGHFLNRAT